MKTVSLIAVAAVLAIAAAATFVWSGAYDVAADEPHWPATATIVAVLRDRSIAVRSAGIEVPADIDSAERVRRGAGNYDAMCAGCHLKPGVEESEIRKGLYPQPPDLARRQGDAAGAALAARWFRVIRHGIKMTAMPSWSRAGVDDGTIWDMVALLRQMPGMSAEEYAAQVAASEGHAHAGAEGAHESATGGADHHDAPGAPPHSHDH